MVGGAKPASKFRGSTLFWAGVQSSVPRRSFKANGPCWQPFAPNLVRVDPTYHSSTPSTRFGECSPSSITNRSVWQSLYPAMCRETALP